MKRMLLIANLHSGKGIVKNNIIDVVDYFTKNDYLVTLYTTQKKKDATNIVRKNIKDFDLIVCCGGDGTLNEVVTGALDTEYDRKIGYIPAGTTNDFATSLNIPKDLMKAAKLIPAEEIHSIDIGTFNNKKFVYIASFGLFSESSYETPQELKKVLGHLAYVLNSVKSLINIVPYHLKIEYEDKVIEDDFIWGAISNSTSVGGVLKLDKKKVKMDDGKFEVILLKSPKNPLELQNVLSRLFNQEFDDEYARLIYVDKIKITSKTRVPWTLDGEYGGKHHDVDIEVNKHAIDLIFRSK